MNELEPSTGAVVATTGGVIDTVVKYTIVIAQLAWAGIKLSGLSEQVRATYRYVEGCSDSVDRLAEQMSKLLHEGDTVSEHHQAAAVMRGVLAAAEAMAEETEDLSILFGEASDAHRGDYGPVADAIHTMPVPMPEAEFLSNR